MYSVSEYADDEQSLTGNFAGKHHQKKRGCERSLFRIMSFIVVDFVVDFAGVSHLLFAQHSLQQTPHCIVGSFAERFAHSYYFLPSSSPPVFVTRIV